MYNLGATQELIRKLSSIEQSLNETVVTSSLLKSNISRLEIVTGGEGDEEAFDGGSEGT
jgi:hypothetical protein